MDNFKACFNNLVCTSWHWNWRCMISIVCIKNSDNHTGFHMDCELELTTLPTAYLCSLYSYNRFHFMKQMVNPFDSVYLTMTTMLNDINCLFVTLITTTLKTIVWCDKSITLCCSWLRNFAIVKVCFLYNMTLLHEDGSVCSIPVTDFPLSLRNRVGVLFSKVPMH